jgi:hypothetical protein
MAVQTFLYGSAAIQPACCQVWRRLQIHFLARNSGGALRYPSSADSSPPLRDRVVRMEDLGSGG